MPPVALLLHPAARDRGDRLHGASEHRDRTRGAGRAVHWRARQRPASVQRLSHAGQRASFFAALALIFFSLNGSLHDLSDDYLFSAHMVQHLAAHARRAAAARRWARPAGCCVPLCAWRGVGAGGALAHHAGATASSIFNVVLAAWHLPPLYKYAMAHHRAHRPAPDVHDGGGADVVAGAQPAARAAAALVPGADALLFLLSIPMSLVAVCIGYADHVLYPCYASAPRIWGITPMQDQMIGALIMWIPGGLFFFAIISVVFYKWQQLDGDESTRGGAGARDEPG